MTLLDVCIKPCYEPKFKCDSTVRPFTQKHVTRLNEKIAIFSNMSIPQNLVCLGVKFYVLNHVTYLN